MHRLIRAALRSYRRAPVLWVASALILSLAVTGLATAYSLARGVLFRPLAFARPERLVAVWPEHFLSQADLLFLREQSKGLEGVAAVAPGWGMALSGAGEPTRVMADRVSANLFEVLGARPLLGRTFRPGEDALGAARVVVVSHGLWRSRLGSDPGIVGRSIRLDDQPVEVVGVMAPTFETFYPGVDLWTPLPVDSGAWYHTRSVALLLARLAPGVELVTADAELRSLLPTWRSTLGYPSQFGADARLADLRSVVLGDARKPILLLLGAVALILLIAGANLGALLLVRGMARGRELAVRTALGASRVRLVAGLVGENLALALVASILGIVLARQALSGLLTLLPPDTPRLAEVALGPSTAAAVVLASVAVSCAFATLTAVLLGRRYARRGLHQGQRAASGHLTGATRALVAAEIALTVILGLGAALMIRTLGRLESVDTGFTTSGVLTLRVEPGGLRYESGASRIAYYRQVLERLRALPGVEAAGAVQHLPLAGVEWTGSLQVEGMERPPGATPPRAGLRVATDGYFAALGIRRISGRDFTPADSAEGADAVIVSEALARRFLGGADRALGRRLHLGGDSRGTVVTWSTVVGVVGDIHHRDLRAPDDPDVYRPLSATMAPAMAVALRTSGDPSRMVPAVLQAVRSLDATVPIAEVQPLAAIARAATLEPRLLGTLLAALSAIGLLVASSGVYGLFSFAVQQGRRELAVRSALGARPRQAVARVVAGALWCATLGLGLGLPPAMALGRLVRSLLFEVEPTDGMAAAAVTLLVLLTAALAAWVPARRAARVDPREALQGD